MSTNHVARVACHVQAQTPYGPVRLGLTERPDVLGGSARMDNIDIALALSRCDPLLIELSDWLACDLDPSPIDSGTPEPQGLQAMVGLRVDGESPEGDEERHGRDIASNGLAPAGTECHLPWAALLNLPEPPGLLGSQLTWPSLRCEMEVARYARPPAREPQLHAGCLMLLPLSFAERWPVRLTQRDHDVELHCEWQVNSGSLRHPGPVHLRGQDAMADAPAWRVLLRDLVDVPSDWLLGWRETPLSVEAAGTQARLHAPDGPVPWTEGTIVPALRGAALLVDRDAALPA